jgi:hypothetical protein
MKTRLFLALICLATWAISSAAPVAAAEGIRKAELDALAKELEASATDWMAGKNPDGALENKIKAVTYDDGSISALVSVLSVSRKDPVDLYVATRLLGPLTMAKPDVVRKAMPSISPICRKLIRYLDFPKLTKQEVDALKLPDASLSVEKTVQAKAELQKRQEAKLAREQPIKLHNEQAYRLEKLFYRLLVLAADSAADQELIDALFRAEQQGLHTFADIAEMVRAEVANLGEKRAKFYYEGLKRFCSDPRILYKKHRYKDLGKVNLNLQDTSGFDSKEESTGEFLVKVINQIATSAKMPALKVPTKEEIDKAAQKKDTKGK